MLFFSEYTVLYSIFTAVSGKVEDMAPDVDCYKEFCKSPEGIQSNACNTGQVRLFNVNESESLGPCMY
jgi:hypothetical protein